MAISAIIHCNKYMYMLTSECLGYNVGPDLYQNVCRNHQQMTLAGIELIPRLTQYDLFFWL